MKMEWCSLRWWRTLILFTSYRCCLNPVSIANVIVRDQLRPRQSRSCVAASLTAPAQIQTGKI